MADFENSPEYNAQYKQFLAAGDLQMQCCLDCQTYRHPARFVCAECNSLQWDWKPISGNGEVETFAWYLERFHPDAPEPPYNVGLVKLDEGIRVFANILDVKMESLMVGSQVSAHIIERRGEPLLCFRMNKQDNLRAATAIQ